MEHMNTVIVKNVNDLHYKNEKKTSPCTLASGWLLHNSKAQGFKEITQAEI